jgi:hypothetical protein
MGDETVRTGQEHTGDHIGVMHENRLSFFCFRISEKYRKARKMSQQALSNQLELMGVYVCRGSVSRIEDRSRTVTDIELYAIAEVLGVTVGTLFEKSTSSKI